MINLAAPIEMTTMAYISKEGWCAQTPIPTKYVKGAIKNYGEARVEMECLHMKDGCAVIPEGTLSKFLKEADVVAKYPRRRTWNFK